MYTALSWRVLFGIERAAQTFFSWRTKYFTLTFIIILFLETSGDPYVVPTLYSPDVEKSGDDFCKVSLSSVALWAL